MGARGGASTTATAAESWEESTERGTSAVVCAESGVGSAVRWAEELGWTGFWVVAVILFLYRLPWYFCASLMQL